MKVWKFSKKCQLITLTMVFAFATAAFAQSNYTVFKNGVDVDLASSARETADDALGNLQPFDLDSPTGDLNVQAGRAVQFRGGNVQVNNSALDNEQIFAGFRPFEARTQSETTVAHSGNNIVVSYNTSAGQPLVLLPQGLFFQHRFLSGFSTSNDGGKTWNSGLIPPVSGSLFTFGDGVVVADRAGNFYYAGLGADAQRRSTVQVNKSTDGGRTWGNAVVVQQDNGSDKEWITVGPDPADPSKDDIYITWTSFQNSGAQLRMGKSTDGGLTWSTQTVFAPAANNDPVQPQNSLQFSTPAVDSSNGRLYISFAHFSNSDTDFLRILRSDDGGNTFSFVNFNIPGAILPSVVPIVQPGELVDCGGAGTAASPFNFRLAIHDGPALPGRFGIRRFAQATRLIPQADLGVQNGVVYLSWSNSTGQFFGDPSTGSNIFFTKSTDGGNNWSSPTQVSPAVATDVHHFLPTLSIDKHTKDVHIVYYTQHADGTVDFDMTNSRDGGNSFPADRAVRVTPSAFVLPPTNIPLSLTNLGSTTNFDRTLQTCYGVGEYVGADSADSANGTVFAVWGDGRNQVTEPINSLDPISGRTHSQMDVVFQSVKAH